MKKIAAILALFALLVNTTAFAEPDVLKSSDGDYEYTAAGVITSYYGGENAVVPAEIDGTKIKEIGVMAFFDIGISSVYIEEGIEEINTNAFEGCTAAYVDIPASVTSIGEHAFANCSELSVVTLNSEQVKFDYNVFIGTGYIRFDIPCTVSEDVMREKISNAKGDNNFDFGKIHSSLVESMTEKDIFGENMIYCEDCGFKGSKYLEDVSLPFEDVNNDAWYYPYVQTAYSFGIINGKSQTVFDPDAGLTCAETAKIAACIHAYNSGLETEFQGYGEHWYDVYVDYCYYNNIIDDYISFDWDKNATRAEMAYMFSRCDTEPYEINPDVPLTDIPDVYDTTAFAYEILDLYRRGIAVGSDEYMTFYPNAQVKRSEAAAFIARILCYDMRIGLSKG